MIKTKKLKDLAGKDFKIKEIYNPYRMGWVDSLKKYRSFIKFPLTDDEVLVTGEPRIDEVKKMPLDKFIWREKLYENGAYIFKKVNTDKDFYKAFGKVFDIIVETEKPTTLKVYDFESKGEIDKSDTEINITGIPASRIKQMIEVLVDEEIPTERRKDRAGNDADLPIFDYEDTFKDKLKGKFAKFKVSGSGLDTKYTFLPGKEFKVEEEINIEDIPFN